MSDMSLWSTFLNNTGRLTHKWTHYFPAYERHFGRFVNRPCVFWEIGCGKGGSLQMWKQYLGPYAQIVGLDILPAAAEFAEEQIAVRIGDQADRQFLQAVLAEFGAPDVVLDDGSHRMSDITASFQYLYPRMSPTGVYLVEDLHTAYWEEYGGGLGRPESFIEVSKTLIDELNAVHARDDLQPSPFTAATLSMHYYDSIVVFERGRHLHRHAPKTGVGAGWPAWRRALHGLPARRHRPAR
jgi:SAM-dependent methyltransferase